MKVSPRPREGTRRGDFGLLGLGLRLVEKQFGLSLFYLNSTGRIMFGLSVYLGRCALLFLFEKFAESSKDLYQDGCIFFKDP